MLVLTLTKLYIWELGAASIPLSAFVLGIAAFNLIHLSCVLHKAQSSVTSP